MGQSGGELDQRRQPARGRRPAPHCELL